jgi:hypothetical protein
MRDGRDLYFHLNMRRAFFRNFYAGNLPNIEGVSPDFLVQAGGIQTLTLYGGDFVAGAQVEIDFGAGQALTVVSPTLATIAFDPVALAKGYHPMSVQNPTGAQGPTEALLIQ